MTRKLKLPLLSLFMATATIAAHAETNLLQELFVSFNIFTQGAPVITSSGTNNVIDQAGFGTKQLIAILSTNGFAPGDMLVRAQPVTNTTVDVTNLVAISTTNLVLTNIGTTNNITNAVIFGGLTNDIGVSNLVFGTNIQSIAGSNVTAGTNIASVVSGASTNAMAFTIGTNTTVATTTLTNALGDTVGTNYDFTINSIDIVPNSTNSLGAAAWMIYNPKANPKLTPIDTNTFFDVYTHHVFDDGTNLAFVHGETIKRNGVIKFGTRVEVRTLVLTNSVWHIKLDGFAKGHVVPVSVGDDVVYSESYPAFAANGSGTTNLVTSGATNSTILVIDGNISETFLTELKH